MRSHRFLIFSYNFQPALRFGRFSEDLQVGFDEDARQPSAPRHPLAFGDDGNAPEVMRVGTCKNDVLPRHIHREINHLAQVEQQIDRLPDAFRLVFVLRAVEELSVEEVALALDIPEATVRTRFFRARSLLREGLAQRTDAAVADAFGFDGTRCDRIVERVLARLAAEPSP